MDFELLDYSHLFFKDTRRGEIPRRRSGKFVHIISEAGDKEYVILSPKELSVYHANVVERFCVLRKIAGSYSSKDYFIIREGDWVVAGGGFWAIDDGGKILELSGASKAYGPFTAGGMKGKVLRSGLLPGYSIIVNGS